MQLYYDRWQDVPERMMRGLTPNFSARELACKGSGSLLLNTIALHHLQALRDAFGGPVYLTSAYRSPEHNAAVGGAKNSKHLMGIAFDVQHRDGLTPDVLQTLARDVGFTCVRPYDSFSHIDLGPDRTW